MITFVGMGLWDIKDISVKGLNAVRKADEVYIEFYTSKISSTIEEIEKFLGVRVRVLERKDLEEESHRLVERARNRDVVVLVPGDPMVATTHSALRLEAEKSGVKTKIIHGASIISAVCGITGLHSYRFGKSATVSWHPSRVPVDVIEENRKIDAHTLLLLDLNPKPMLIEDAVDRLTELEPKVGNYFAVGIARAGSDCEAVKCDRLEKLKKHDFGKPLHTIVVLAKTLHFMEYECLQEFASAPLELKEVVR